MADQFSPDEREESTECWYWVKASWKAVNPGEVRRRHLWDTTVFLIRGPRTSDASIPAAVTRKAEEFARQKECEYEAVGGHTVRWVFQHLDAAAPLSDDEFVEGTEVYWEFYEKVDKKPSGSAKE